MSYAIKLYVVYLLPNHPGDNDGGIWDVEAKDPDEALTQFQKFIEPQVAKVVACVSDYGLACEKLLKGR